jgi:autotransporter-associated beta strand protein
VSDGTDTRFSFLTYDTGADPNNVGDDPGLRPLAWASEHATTLGSGGNVRLTGSHELGTPAPLRSLNLAEASLQLNDTTLTVQSGMIFQGSAGVGSALRGSGTVHFASEGVVLAFGGGSTSHAIDVPVRADVLTKGGSGKLVLGHANFLPGGVHIAEGVLASRAAGALSGATVTFSGGTLDVEEVSQSIPFVRTLGYSQATSIGCSAWVPAVVPCARLPAWR